MKHVYTVHTKKIEDKIYYFVKKLMSLPEFEDLANVVVGYGMHTNFDKACRIAGVHDTTSRNQLLQDLEKQNIPCIQQKTANTPADRTQKPRVRQSIQIVDTVTRWLAERGAAVLN